MSQDPPGDSVMPWQACAVMSCGAEEAPSQAPSHSTWAPTSTSPRKPLSPPACMCVPGLHTYQRMIGCELLEDGSTTGFLLYAYDGQDFIIFNKDTLSWMAVDNVAHITKQAWEANWHELQYQKNWLEQECVAWLRRFLEYGKDTLQRTGKEEREHLDSTSSEPVYFTHNFL